MVSNKFFDEEIGSKKRAGNDKRVTGGKVEAKRANGFALNGVGKVVVLENNLVHEMLV